MFEGYFNYEGKRTKFSCKKDEFIMNICIKYTKAMNKNVNELDYVYENSKITEQHTFNDILKHPYINLRKADIIAIKKNDYIRMKYKTISSCDNIQILGQNFVLNNKDKCTIIYKGKISKSFNTLQKAF